MATKIRGITVEIGGDTSPLAKSLKDLNGTISKTRSELNDVEKLLKLDPSNTVLLAQKQEILRRQIESVTEKVDVLRSTEKELEERRKSDPTNVQLQQQLRAVQRELIDAENYTKNLRKSQDDLIEKQKELAKTTENLGEEVEKSAKEHRTFKDRVHEVVNKLKDFVTGNRDAGKSVTDSATEINSKIEIWQRFGDSVSNAASKLWGMVTNAAQAADDLNTLSKITGLSVETLQKFNYASSLVDVSQQTLQDSLRRLTKGMNDYRNGTGEAREGLQKLRINVVDAHNVLRDSEEVFYEIIDALNAIKNPAERDAIAMKIFGESATNLNPLILSGSQALRDYGEQAEAAGIIMSQDAVDGANALNDVLDMLKSTIDGIITKTGAELAVGVAAILEKLTPLILAVAKLIGFLAKIPTPVYIIIGVIAGVVAVIVSIKSATTKAKAGFDMFTKGMSASEIKFIRIALIIMAVVAALTLLVGVIAALCNKGDDVKRTLDTIADTDISSGMNDMNKQINSIPRYAKGTNNHPGGLAFITEFSPEQLSLPNGTNMVVMPRGTKVNPNISASGMGGDVFNISINARDVKEFNDIVNMAKKARIERRSM